MKVEMRDETTLIITPETVAEQIILSKMAGARVEIESPRPFEQNIQSLIVVKK